MPRPAGKTKASPSEVGSELCGIVAALVEQVCVRGDELLPAFLLRTRPTFSDQREERDGQCLMINFRFARSRHKQLQPSRIPRQPFRERVLSKHLVAEAYMLGVRERREIQVACFKSGELPFHRAFITAHACEFVGISARFSIAFVPRSFQSPAAMDLSAYLPERQKAIDRALDRFLPKASVKPRTIHEAMRYSLFAGGKRLRPILCLAAAEACGGKIDAAMPMAGAVECIHTYSLVHDDLPSMDNDDFRRGRPTCHKAFGEGIAVLAGDALLTVAFEITARAEPTRRYSLRDIFNELAAGAGSRKLIAGQVADLEAEGKTITRTELRFIHENKTAALLTTSVRLGAMSANATRKQLEAITEFGRSLGLAFQVIDDILDVTQTSEKLGKSAGKDVAAKKATYPAVIGLQKSRREAQRLTSQAHAALKSFGERGEVLRALAAYLLSREY